MDKTTEFGQNQQQQRGKSAEHAGLQQDFNDVKESISKAAYHATERAGDLLKEVQYKTSDLQNHLMTYVRENPVKSVGFSVMAGFIAALLIRK